MKATTWLCPVFTLLCATQLVYTAQRESYGGYAFDDIDSQNLQNDYFRSKRNKPSLSIVNPLDVLRQRLLLEIARRQMKENSRQVELNRAILKNVGKRMASKYSSPMADALYDVNESQQQQMQQDLMQHLPASYEYELIPTTLIFDYLQKQQQQQQQQEQQQQVKQPHYSWLPYAANALQFDNNYINDVMDGSSDGQLDDSEENDAEQDEVLAINGLLGSSGGHSLKHLKQTNNEHSNTANEQQQQEHDKTTFQKSINKRAEDDTKRLTLIKNHQSHHQNSQSTGNSNSNNNNNLNLDLNDANPLTSSNPNANDFKNEINVNGAGDYQIQRYLYHLHKNHLTRK